MTDGTPTGHNFANYQGSPTNTILSTCITCAQLQISVYMSRLLSSLPLKILKCHILKQEYRLRGVLCNHQQCVCSFHLEDMGITDDADRLKILQQITSMRADIVTSGSASPARRLRSPLKNRKFSDSVYPAPPSMVVGGHMGVGSRSPRSRAGTVGANQNLRNRYVNVSVPGQSPRTSDSGTSVMNSPTQLSTDQTSSDSRESSRISTPDKPLQDIILSDMECNSRRGLDQLSKIHTVATLRYHNVKRLSRSLDHIFPVSYDDRELSPQLSDTLQVSRKVDKSDHSY